VLRHDAEGNLRLHGVNSRGYRADPTSPQSGMAKDLLPVGTAVAMIGHPDTTALIETSLADPCRNITSGGHCSATLAIRCGVELSPPIVSVLDCAEMGATCKVGIDGAVGCDDP
jgi:hypothetical protein